MDNTQKMLVNYGVIQGDNIDIEKLHGLLDSDIAVNSEVSFSEKLSMVLLEKLDKAENDVERIKMLSDMFNTIKGIVIPDAPNLEAMMGGNMQPPQGMGMQAPPQQ